MSYMFPTLERLRFTFTANGKLLDDFLRIENKPIKTVPNDSYG